VSPAWRTRWIASRDAAAADDVGEALAERLLDRVGRDGRHRVVGAVHELADPDHGRQRPDGSAP
jgi:hypothetical protein